MFSDLDDDGFGGGRIAFVGGAVDGYEYVGFGEVGGGAALWDAERNDNELPGDALYTIMKIEEVYNIPGMETTAGHILGVHEDDPALVVHTPVTVVEAVDGGIELVVAADGHHDVLAVL